MAFQFSNNPESNETTNNPAPHVLGLPRPPSVGGWGSVANKYHVITCTAPAFRITKRTSTGKEFHCVYQPNNEPTRKFREQVKPHPYSIASCVGLLPAHVIATSASTSWTSCNKSHSLNRGLG